ncbi:MAG: hypothetical protein E6614_33810, partial [Bradyrhizobium sp.]|nr:hypothetical protein [Bradyrhizobium sp.]
MTNRLSVASGGRAARRDLAEFEGILSFKPSDGRLYSLHCRVGVLAMAFKLDGRYPTIASPWGDYAVYSF